MNVILLKFSKKDNSTKQPDITGITPISCELKDDTSVLNPVLIFSPSFLPTPAINPVSLYNYALINNFQRYYFITDWQYILGRWQATLRVDVLASYKSAIGGMQEYVVRSASSYNNNITDTYYPTLPKTTQITQRIESPFNSTGVFVVGIISNDNANTLGAVNYYFMSYSELSYFKSYLMSETFLSANSLDNLAEMSKELLKTLYNPFQYITSCIWLPINPSQITGTIVNSVNFGWWSIPATARKMTTKFMGEVTCTITLPAHPQALTRGDYLNRSPYTQYTLYFPPFGAIAINPNTNMNAGDTVLLAVDIDGVTGQGVLRIFGGSTSASPIIYEAYGDCCVQIQLAQMGVDNVQLARTVINGAVDTMSNALSLNIGGAISSAANGVLNALEAQFPQLSSSGTNGSFLSLLLFKMIVADFHHIVNEDLAHFGRPLCSKVQLSTLSGYILVSHADVELSCLGDERDLIKNYLETGFFYE